jgi:hypothetical protein
MSSIRDNLLSLLYENGIPQREIASAVGMSDQLFHYQINHAKHFDKVLENNIKKYLNKKGLTLMDDCGKLSNLTLEFTALIGHEVNILASTVARDVLDGDLTDFEKKDLKQRVADMRININAELDKLEELLK